MTDDHQNDFAIRRAARDATAAGQDIRNEVRDIVADAAAGKPLEPDSLRHVLTLVLEGAAEGAPEGTEEAAAAMRKAGEGIGDAMERVAEASRLAIEEARGRGDDFSEIELKRAAENLETLDRLFIDTMQDFARAGATTARRTIGDLATHLERGGKDTARAVRDAAEALGQGMAATGRPHLSDVNRAARAGIGTIAGLGSAILGGIAEGLAARDEAPTPDDKTPDDTKKDS